MSKSILMLLSVASLGVAWAGDNFHVDLYQPATVNGTAFKAGDAKVELKDNKVSFKQGKTTAESPVRVETNKDKFQYTSIVYKSATEHQIKEICIGGTTTRIVFEEPSAPIAAGQK